MTTQARYKACQYTYRVVLSRDGRNVGVCTEFPVLSFVPLAPTRQPTHQEALDGIIGLVSDVLAELSRKNLPAPAPLAIRLLPPHHRI